MELISKKAVIKHICESRCPLNDWGKCKGREEERCIDIAWVYNLPTKDGIESANKILKDLKEEIGCMMHLNQFGMQLIDKQIVEYVIDEKLKEVQNEQIRGK